MAHVSAARSQLAGCSRQDSRIQGAAWPTSDDSLAAIPQFAAIACTDEPAVVEREAGKPVRRRQLEAAGTRLRSSLMSSNVTVDRLQFALTVTFHYLFPILTMGLALFIAWMKTVAYLGREDRRLPLLRKTPEERQEYEHAASFWMKIFAVNFAFGVVTGIPLEFQFGTNWARFSAFAGGVIGQTLAMEGVFAFFLESAFLGIFLAGRQRVGDRLHWLSSLAIFVGSWVSGFFIIATNAFMQHPSGYERTGDHLQLSSFGDLVTNPWLPWQYAHNMLGAAMSGAFVIAAMGAFFLLVGRNERFGRLMLRISVPAALVICVLQIFPTGDQQGVNVHRYQPSTFAAMEAVFESGSHQPLAIIGNPDTKSRKLDSPLEFPDALTFLTYKRYTGKITGLNDIPTKNWPSSVPLVYYAYHIMVGLGTILLAIAAVCAFLLWRGKLFNRRPALWALLLAFPFTYIANIAGWTTAEAGRQPWIVYGLQRTADAASPASSVSAGTGIFTLLGFAGLYLFAGILYLMLIVRIVNTGPDVEGPASEPAPSGVA
jgi:cytochrome bd ubiquinol oxidase subunit I